MIVYNDNRGAIDELPYTGSLYNDIYISEIDYFEEDLLYMD